MREIKFRAWHKKEKRMTFVDSLIFTENGGIWVSDFPDTGNIELMQFTGLKDKNGVEIFEGDIVRYVYPVNTGWGSDSKGIITYEGTGFHLNCFEGVGRVSAWLVSIPNDEGKLFEVIGNIYQNPELLVTK